MGSDPFKDKVNGIMLGGYLALDIAIGNQLNLFDELAKGSKEHGYTSQSLADALDLKERYIREWFGAMATSQIIDVCDTDGEFYLIKEKLKYLSVNMPTPAVFSHLFIKCCSVYDDVLKAFHKDGPNGVPYEKYYDFFGWREKWTTHVFPNFISKQLLPSVARLEPQLRSGGIEVCEMGCSTGILSMMLAEQFPKSSFIGFDISSEAIKHANEMARAKNLTNVVFETHDASLLPKDWCGKFDYVLVYDVIHDLGRPDLGVQGLYNILKSGGIALIVDVKAHTRMKDNMDNPDAPMLYSISLFHCMVVSLAQGDDAWGLGTVYGMERAQQLFKESGFKDVQVVDLKDFNVLYVCQK